MNSSMLYDMLRIDLNCHRRLHQDVTSSQSLYVMDDAADLCFGKKNLHLEDRTDCTSALPLVNKTYEL